MIRPALIGATLAAAAGLTACGGDDPSVTIRTFIFSPDPLTVDAGTTVRFTNQDGTVHTVTAEGRFDEQLPEGRTAEITFDEPGRVAYLCTRHPGPGMRGVVIVR